MAFGSARLQLCTFACAVLTAVCGCHGGKTQSSSAGGNAGDGGGTADAGVAMVFPKCSAAGTCNDGFCSIPAGTFTMGSPPDEAWRGQNNETQTEVTLTHAFVIQQTEATQAQWTALGFSNLAGTVQDSVSGTDCVGPDCPASTLTWCEAVEFANRWSRAEGRSECAQLTNARGAVGADFMCDGATFRGPSYYDCDGYRLPTSGEWEYAARAGTQTAFSSGPWENASDQCFDIPHLSRAAWYCVNSERRTHEVCTREPNRWGLYDTTGNAGELVADSGQFGYGPGPVTDPPIAVSQEGLTDWRVVRGGSWFMEPFQIRSACEAGSTMLNGPHARRAGQGFRLVRTVSSQDASK